jgi:DNA-binding XRE family transcriptional regulator
MRRRTGQAERFGWFVTVEPAKETLLGHKPIDVIVGERLGSLRTSRGVTLDQLGSVIGKTGGEVADYEAGRVRIPSADLIEICKFFQVTIQSLFPSQDPDQDPLP